MLQRFLEVNERTARDQARTWQTILESLPDGVIGADENGKFVCFNAAAARILGVGRTTAPPEAWPETYGVFLADGKTPCSADRLPLVRAMRGEKIGEDELFIRN